MEETLAKRIVGNVSASRITQIKNVTHARMDITIFQAVLTANAIFTELSLKFVIKILANAYAEMDMDQLDVIVAFLDFSTILIVFHVIVQQWARPHRCAIKMESAPALVISLAKDVISAWLDFINFPSACHVIAIITVLSA